VQLKHHFSSGYRVSVPTDVKFDISSEFDDIAKYATHDQATFQLADYAQTARFVNKLEGDGIRGYDISGPTLEDVFLRLAEEVKADMQDTSVTTLQAGVSPKDMDGLPLSDVSSLEDKDL